MIKKILKNLLILIVIVNFIGIIAQSTSSIHISKTTIINAPIKNNRLKTIREKGVITVASPIYDYPFFYINPETKEITGIDADIITEIAKRLGIDKVEMKETQFSNLLEKLNTDDSVDMAAGGIYITPERKEIVAFTEPLYKETETVVVPRFSKINFMSDLKDAVVGVEKGTEFEDLVRKWKQNNLVKDITIFENTSDLLKDVNNQKVDAGLADSVVVNSFLVNDKTLNLRTLKDYTSELPGTIGIAVKNNDSSLLNAINEKINEMKADGTLYAILVENGLDKKNMLVS